MDKPRCHWCNLKNPLYVAYHDQEWCVPTHDDRKLFELLVLESFQSGLSWECVLNKREAFRTAFEGFAPTAVASYDESRIAALLRNPGIIRHRAKITAAIANAQAFLRIQEEFGSFDAYIWSFSDGRIIKENHRVQSPLSDAVSKDLKRRGVKFVGSVTIYSYLQAIGVLNSHEDGCWCA
ncbi:MAG: DNA-3-methyladenine glycosylase I [Kiritimatiellae bacterium]|nr:DNA-3-methyladenine glycosylase I [Kiritimatiellia bacterium]